MSNSGQRFVALQLTREIVDFFLQIFALPIVKLKYFLYETLKNMAKNTENLYSFRISFNFEYVTLAHPRKAQEYPPSWQFP